jgi:hypothetical protein
MPFPALQGLFDPLLPTGLQWYWKGDFVKELSDQAIDVHLKCAAKAPSELSLMHANREFPSFSHRSLRVLVKLSAVIAPWPRSASMVIQMAAFKVSTHHTYKQA